MKRHTVAQGECLASIAFENGLFWETIWQRDENAALREKRKSPHVLLAGDVVTVPDLRPATFDCQTGKRNVYRRRGVPEVLRIAFNDGGVPRAKVPYTVTVDGETRSGKTDADGYVVEHMMPDVKKATITLEPPGAPEETYEVELRHLDPDSSLSGAQGRLRNLGLYDGGVDGQTSDAFTAAVKAFQLRSEIEPTGELDDRTKQALADAHGC